MSTVHKPDLPVEEQLEFHRLWLDHAPRGVRADFSGATLSDVRLDGADLREAILRGAPSSKAACAA
jgi:uncharacterized protein YjbI with pentapeptide repeats